MATVVNGGLCFCTRNGQIVIKEETPMGDKATFDILVSAFTVPFTVLDKGWRIGLHLLHSGFHVGSKSFTNCNQQVRRAVSRIGVGEEYRLALNDRREVEWRRNGVVLDRCPCRGKYPLYMKLYDDRPGSSATRAVNVRCNGGFIVRYKQKVVATLHSEKRMLQPNTATLQDEKATRQREKQEIQTQNEGLEAHVAITQAEKEMLQATVAALQDEKATVQREKQEIQTQNERLEAHVAITQAEKEMLQATVAAVQDEKATAQCEKQEIQTEKERLEATVAILHSERAALQDEKATVQCEKQEIQTEKESLEAKVAIIQAEKEMLQANVAALQEEKATVQCEKQEIQTEKESLEAKVAIIQAEKASLSDKITALQNLKAAILDVGKAIEVQRGIFEEHEEQQECEHKEHADNHYEHDSGTGDNGPEHSMSPAAAIPLNDQPIMIENCYLPKNTAFKRPDGQLVLAEYLRQGDSVLMCGGQPGRVAEIGCHARQEYPYALVHLSTNQGSFKLSAGCQVEVVGQAAQTLRAIKLRRGDRVRVGTEERTLTKVQDYNERAQLVWIRFEPDISVETFYIPSWGIQTRGEQTNNGDSVDFSWAFVVPQVVLNRAAEEDYND